MTAFPLLQFSGRVYYLTTQEETDAWCSCLTGHNIMGFDTEWKPTYTKGQPQNRTALIQLCYRIYHEPVCLLIHISRCGISSELRRVLASEEILKAGMAANGDAEKLKTGYDADVGGVVDLGKVVRDKDMTFCLASNVQYTKNETSLLGLSERLLGCSLSKSKRIQCSNWEKFPLSQGQLQYSANDAYASLLCYEALMQLPNKPVRRFIRKQLSSPTPHPLAQLSNEPSLPASPSVFEVAYTAVELPDQTGYVPKFGCQKTLDEETRVAYRLFMGVEHLHLQKHAITEVAQQLHSSVEHVCMLLADIILAGWAYDWNRITIPIKITEHLAVALLRCLSQGREPPSFAIEGGHPLASPVPNIPPLEYSVDRLMTLIVQQGLVQSIESEVIDFRTILQSIGINIETVVTSTDDVISHGSSRVAVAHIGRMISDRLLNQPM